MFENPPDSVIRDILSNHRTIAVVGCSPNEYRDSNMIARFLIGQGHTVIPVNPYFDTILGLKCYPDLLSITGRFEMVDVFRRSEFVLPIAHHALDAGAKIFWTQLGVYDEEAAALLQPAGMTVVMNRCPKIEAARLNIKTL